MIYNGQTEQIEEEVLVHEGTGYTASLILHNDDFNTFDFVISCLVKICRHDPLQAEQCALLVHYTGKAVVKTGAFDTLKPMCQALADRGLSVSIDKNKKDE
jgi:ATP-dependent Clp protease adaptor protein ClpS